MTELPEIATVDDIKQQTTSEYLIRINKGYKHDPGQFFQISLFNIGEAPISICSYDKNYIEMSIRSVGNVTDKLNALQKGDTIGIRGPYGRGYPMHDFKDNNLILIGGGSGVAPLRGVIQYIEKHRDDYKDVHLFFGFREPKEMLFKEDIESYKEKFDVHLTVDHPDDHWKGNVGVITKLLEESRVSNENTIVFLCGPPIMMKFGLQTLEKMGFNRDQVYLSFERQMKCGEKKCGHCMMNGVYVCKEGPVFRYDEVEGLSEKW